MVPHDIDALGGARLVERVRSLAQRLTRLTNRRLASDGMSYSRARLLFQLDQNGPTRATDLARLFSQAPRTLTEAIDGLERDEFVVRDADPVDRRVKHIRITEKGRAVLARSLKVGIALSDEMMTLLGHDDAATLTMLLDRIDRHFADDATEDGGATRSAEK